MLRLNVLGGLSVQREGRALSGSAAQPRRLALLARLARAGEAGITREKALATLWPDSDEERARRTLNQTLYAIRKDLDAEDVIIGLKDLRLNPELISCDLADFTVSMASGEFERAASLYCGPFLDGFHLPGVGEFERWADGERIALAHEHAATLEHLAKRAAAAGDHAGASGWWRRRAALDPLNARIAVALMRSLDLAGDTQGAIQHARIYELLIEQDLELPPDRDVIQLAEQLRARASAPRSAALPETVAVLTPPEPSPTLEPTGPNALTALSAVPRPIEEPPTPAAAKDGPNASPPERIVAAAGIPGRLPPTVTHHARLTRATRIAAAVVTVGVLAAGIAAVRRYRTTIPATSGPLVAVGRITDYRDGNNAPVAGPLTDMLATNLARASGLQVLSTARLYEVLRRMHERPDSTSEALVAAARQAGANELVDGALYQRGDGSLRLDLRRIDLASGAVRGAYTVSAADLFTVADSGTFHLVAGLGLSPPAGSVADVTTRSVVAYRMYEQGLRAYVSGDSSAAARFFAVAAAEDSTFAMAAYYSAIVARERSSPVEIAERLARAVRLADRATDRERLTIRAGWARAVSSPTMRATAETLAVRYPAEVEGHLYRGIALVHEGEFLAALPHLARVVSMDSLGLRGAGARCGGCEAMRHIVAAYYHSDSLAAGEREARRWLRLQPASVPARQALAEVLQSSGKYDEALAVFRSTAPLSLDYDDAITFTAAHLVHKGDYGEADAMLRQAMHSASPARRAEAQWQLAISLRQQGRLKEAMQAALRYRASDTTRVPTGAVSSYAILQAIVQQELGEPRRAAALYDSIRQAKVGFEAPSITARRDAWLSTHVANALAMSGDTTSLAALADTIRVRGAASGYGRDPRLHHHVRGLLLAARGDSESAIAELRRAIYSPNLGYTRTNLELGRLLLKTGRPREAIGILQPALRGALEASNLYVTRTELHELLAQSWEAAGSRDSAAAHYRSVDIAWRAADPMFAVRAGHARERIALLAR